MKKISTNTELAEKLEKIMWDKMEDMKARDVKPGMEEADNLDKFSRESLRGLLVLDDPATVEARMEDYDAINKEAHGIFRDLLADRLVSKLLGGAL